MGIASSTKTKGVIVAGQYGTGKTQTLAGLIRTASAENSNLRIGAFVAESANIALDAGRYGIGDNAAGVSFASVCCPTLVDMRQALDTALKDRSYDLLFLEPPGNMHPPIMAQVAVERGIKLEHVIMLVSQRDFSDDRYTATFHSGIQIANIIGITHNIGSPPGNEMMDVIKSGNAHAPVISFPTGGLSYSQIEHCNKWSLDNLDGLTGFKFGGHSDHYEKVLRVFDPELSYENIVSGLREIAKTGVVARAKGQLPKYNMEIDMKGKSLEMTRPEIPLSKGGMGYAVFFAKKELPLELIDRISLSPEQKTRQMFEDAPIQSKFAVFGRLYKESQGSLENVTANGKVTYTYSPVDDAEKLAEEIQKDAGDDSAMRMILPFYHGIRLNALKQLDKQWGEHDAENAFSGVHISSVLINTSLNAVFPNPSSSLLADQHHVIEIKARAAPALLHYASCLRTEDIKDFPRFESAVGPYILKAAKIGWAVIQNGQFSMNGALSKARAKENMIKISKEAGFNSLANKWEEL